MRQCMITHHTRVNDKISCSLLWAGREDNKYFINLEKEKSVIRNLNINTTLRSLIFTSDPKWMMKEIRIWSRLLFRELDAEIAGAFLNSVDILKLNQGLKTSFLERSFKLWTRPTMLSWICKTLSTIIHPDKHAYIKNRLTLDALWIIDEVMQYTDLNKISSF